MRNEGVYLKVVIFVTAEVNYSKQIQSNSAHAWAVTQKRCNCNTGCASLSFVIILH